jgi:hypothetical protein
MGGLTGAWLVGVGIVAWREHQKSGRMPIPGALLGVTGLFVGLMLIAEIAPGSQRIVTLGAWGLDIAGLMNILGPANGLFGQVQQTQATEASAEGESTGSGS